VHGTVPEEESFAIASQRESTFVDCAPKALIFKLNISEALASTETKTLRSAKNEANAAKAKKTNVQKSTRKKMLMVLDESAPFGKKLDGSLKSKPGRLLDRLFAKTEK
jgi:hypothetical protein